MPGSIAPPRRIAYPLHARTLAARSFPTPSPHGFPPRAVPAGTPAPAPCYAARVRNRGAISLLLAAACAAIPATGCASRAPKSAEFGVPSAQYDRAINAAREVLLEARFEIDRIDAAAGVITTQAKTSAGLLAPWDADQTTLDQEIADATSTHRRRVRITFEPAAVDRREAALAPSAANPIHVGDRFAAPGTIDLRAADLALTARVEVFVDRARRPGTRLETESIRTSSTAIDPSLSARRMNPEFDTTVDHDHLLAGRLAERIRQRLAQ